jgi:uncharacterized protein (TIGR00251 family)
MRLAIRVRPKSGKECVFWDGSSVLVSVKDAPEKGAANSAVIKLLKRELGWQARIVRGAKSRNKIIEIAENENAVSECLKGHMKKQGGN